MLQERPKVTLALIEDWLDGTRGRVNTKQFDFLQLVANRLMVECRLKDPQDSLREDGAEPLRYMLHGPPGTGKSHVAKFVKQLFRLVGMQEGIDYQFVAFQATNAVDLEGVTMHNAFFLNPFSRAEEKAMTPEKAKRMAYWRWVFIDEISLVPADLFARAEHRLQEVKPQTDEWKQDRENKGSTRPFAGVNVVLIGDFKQLPPPQGGYLADVPHALKVGPHCTSKAPDPLADAGKKLMWEEVEGMIELDERQRCNDEWWNEVTEEIRAGKLSDKNHRYLLGLPVEGCRLSAEERASRRRVITGPDDPRLLEARFQEAPVIVANNDAKYQINKDRAKKFARDTGQKLRWAIAKDVASAEALQSQMCDKDRKIKCLGFIYGLCSRGSLLYQPSRF